MSIHRARCLALGLTASLSWGEVAAQDPSGRGVLPEGSFSRQVCCSVVQLGAARAAGCAIGYPLPPSQPAVALPAGWSRGDNHLHYAGFAPPLLTPEELYAWQLEAEVHVGSALIGFATWMTPEESALEIERVTGEEAAVSAGDPGYVQQAGVEMSFLVPASQFGHTIALGADDYGFFADPTHALQPYPAPLLQVFRSQQKPAVEVALGYAHVVWPAKGAGGTPVYPALSWGGNYPYMGAIDTVHRRCDFFDVIGVGGFCGGTIYVHWETLPYTLWNAGLRSALSAGTDLTYLNAEFAAACAYAKTDPGPSLEYVEWTRAVKAGRTTIADGPHRFLNLLVDQADIGSQLAFAAPALVTVDVTVSAAEAESGTIALVKDGEIHLQQAYAIPSGGGSETWQTTVAFAASGWLAARTDHAHTSPTWVVIGGRPVCDATDAAYWSGYCDHLASILDGFAMTGATPQERAQQRAEIASYVAEAKRVFVALEACAAGPPTGIARYGASSHGAAQPLAAGALGPAVAGSAFTTTCLNAPSTAPGFLLLGAAPAATPLAGITVLVAPPFLLQAVTSNGAGYAEHALPLPAVLAHVQLYAQLVWWDAQAAVATASDGLAVTVLPPPLPVWPEEKR